MLYDCIKHAAFCFQNQGFFLPNTKILLIDTLWFLASQCLISIMSVGGLVHFIFLWFACTVHSGYRANSSTRAFSVNCWPRAVALQLLCRFQVERGQLFCGINLHYICHHCLKTERSKLWEYSWIRPMRKCLSNNPLAEEWGGSCNMTKRMESSRKPSGSVVSYQ